MAMLGVTAPTATAQVGAAKKIVDAAKEQGIVGETIDGYLALVSGSASAEIEAAMNEINIRRKSVYTSLARETGTSPENVAGVSGEKLVAKARRGEKVRLSNGEWQTVK
ncbi:MAG: YdbL family protein [Hyphomonadaceae bacterium]|nr:YdbL family protein [Hyphomonadaceae bacterium]